MSGSSARRLLLNALCLLALLPAVAGARDARADYRLDPVHTRVMFAISHAGFSRAIGTVSGSTGTLTFDPTDWTRAKVDVRVPIARADLGDADWNKATLAKSLLDAEDHPEARFVSTRVEPVDATHARVHGELTLRGVTREVVLDVTLNAAKRHPMPPFRRTVGFSATSTLSRADFGITAWKSMIGDDVELRIEAEATYDGKADDDAPAEDTPPSPPLQTEPTP
ncbi:Polyisoprenoid-binding protein YceI [Pseudoxanthomonas sp. CF385]|uniref:YceI family protein n=1 Tax=Pseudoxanthomonas sp. CF385 TaxID=1881042 RepID=UPI000886D248|nr:YceI family protein [Pseudoxanthomonas sp. CF385]SDQ97100.1 Polyisoprenoid-binding protein YceI [Pseudoxanthomonas sp. CF385]